MVTEQEFRAALTELDDAFELGIKSSLPLDELMEQVLVARIPIAWGLAQLVSKAFAGSREAERTARHYLCLARTIGLRFRPISPALR